MALDPGANLHIVGDLGIHLMRQLPLGHARPWANVVGLHPDDFRCTRLAILLGWLALGFECLLLRTPSAWLLVGPGADAHLVNRPGCQFLQHDLVVRGFHGVFPVGRLAVDALAQLHVVKELGFGWGLRLGPADDGGVLPNFADLDIARFSNRLVFFPVRVFVMPIARFGAKRRLANFPLARLLTQPAAHAHVVGGPGANAVHVNAALGRLGLVPPLADLLFAALTNLHLENDFAIEFAEQAPADLRHLVGGAGLDPGDDRGAVLPVVSSLFARFLFVPTLGLAAQRAEDVLANFPWPRLFVVPSAHARIVNCTGLQAVDLDLAVGGLSGVLPLTSLALSSSPQLHVVRQLGFDFAH